MSKPTSLNRREFLALSASTAGLTVSRQRRPNILLILSADVGYSDLGCQGGEIRTPSLDALAAGGVRFTHFYNSARCCPTRASLLTGVHPAQAGFQGMTGRLPTRVVTIADANRRSSTSRRAGSRR